MCYPRLLPGGHHRKHLYGPKGTGNGLHESRKDNFPPDHHVYHADDFIIIRKWSRYPHLWPRKLTRRTKFGESALVIAQIFNTSGPLATTSCNIYALSSCLLWIVFLAVLANSEDLKWWPFYVSWLGALAVEATLLGLSMSYRRPFYVIEIVQTVSKVCHLILIILLLALYFVKATSKNWKVSNDEEAAPLLAHPDQDPGAPSGPNYDSTATDSPVGNEPYKSVETSDEDNEASKHEAKMKRIRDRIKEKGNWFSYAREFLVSIIMHQFFKNL